jgi:hypothetical protein
MIYSLVGRGFSFSPRCDWMLYFLDVRCRVEATGPSVGRRDDAGVIEAAVPAFCANR